VALDVPNGLAGDAHGSIMNETRVGCLTVVAVGARLPTDAVVNT
jgi:hypothetical protein